MNTAQIINNSSSNLGLQAFFKSLNVPNRKAIMDEINFFRTLYSKKLMRNFVLACFSYLISFVCFFGVQESWFALYLLVINIPLSIFLFVNYKKYKAYDNSLKILNQIAIQES
jgi:hypothetical protein